MVNITLHIERLLVHNDCVIVPGLGGFVAQDCSAKYVEEEELFLPPYRSVSFNQRLTMNDGLLVHDVAQHHHLEYKEAVRVVDEEVAKIRETIEDHGKYTFHGIGTLRNSAKGIYEFEPIACGVSAPDLYGLDCYYVKSLKKSHTAAKTVSVSKQDDDTLTFRLHMNVVRYAAVAAVAAVFFFVCIAPLNSAIEHQRSEAGMLHYLYSLIVNSKGNDANAEAPATTPIAQAAEVKKAAKAENIAAAKVEENVPSNIDANAVSHEAENAEAAAKAPLPSPALTPEDKAEDDVKARPYAIVVASCVTENNANAMIANWKTKGLTAASFYSKGKSGRVFYGTYKSYDNAHEALNKLRADHPAEFAEAWVYEIK